MRALKLTLSLALACALTFCGLAPALARSITTLAWGPYIPETIRIIDGDTFEATFEVFEGTLIKRLVRIKGVNAPEIKSKQVCEQEAARRATTFTAQVLTKANLVTLNDISEDKYSGRVDAVVMVDGKDLAQLLIAAKLGRPYVGGKREAWCAESGKDLT